jgi:phospholipase/carboxylesterase
MAETLACVEIGPREEPDGAVVWLHGLGASGHDFEDIVPILNLPRVRFVFPHAPRRPVTINAGLIMPAWYDILVFGASGGEEPRHVRESAVLVEALLAREEERGVPASRIVLAGFSQGAAMALHVGIRYHRRLLGIMALSGYQILGDTLAAEASPENRTTPLLSCHGRFDDVVDIGRGRDAHETLAHAERPAAWHEFPHGHEVSLEEIEVIRGWLGDLFSETGRGGSTASDL